MMIISYKSSEAEAKGVVVSGRLRLSTPFMSLRMDVLLNQKSFNNKYKLRWVVLALSLNIVRNKLLTCNSFCH